MKFKCLGLLFLGMLVGSEPVFSCQSHLQAQVHQINLNLSPYLKDHVVRGKVIFPGAAFVDIFLSQAISEQKAQPGDWVALRGFAVTKPLELSPNSHVTYSLNQGRGHKVEFMVDGAAYARAKMSSPKEFEPLGRLSITSNPNFHMTHQDVYAFTQAHGLEYGPTFSVMEDLWMQYGQPVQEGTKALGIFKKHPSLSLGGHAFHPALIDAALHSFALLARNLKRENQSRSDSPFVPVFFSEVQYQVQAELQSTYQSVMEIIKIEEDMVQFDLQIKTAQGEVIFVIKQGVLKQAEFGSRL